MTRGGLSRRELLALGAAAGAAAAVDRVAPAARADAASPVVRRLDFAPRPDGPGWGSGWRTAGVANLRCASGEGLLEAGSDVFPNDPRPVAFALDCRIRDGAITATITRPGSAPGVAVRRSAPRSFYAAVHDAEAHLLRLLVRDEADLRELASAPVASAQTPLKLTLEATGSGPTELRATLEDATGLVATARASDSTPATQAAGDAGVLATAQTLFPSGSNPVLPALGNLHLLPWAVQEGQAFMATDAGEAVIAEIRRRSTAGFASIEITSLERPGASRPSVVAATTGAWVRGGARLHVASDLPARVAFELSYSPDFKNSWRVHGGRTGPFDAASRTVTHLHPGRRVYWRAHLTRRHRRSPGPVRSFRVPPGRGHGRPVRIAVAACGSQFGPIFGHLAATRPDLLVWQGDLNYPDTHGPLAQTVSGYAGIWRDFLANPVMAPVLERTAFAPQRDDHDYGLQDSNSTTIPRYPWAVGPWRALMNRRTFYRFRAGSAEVWVLDQRLFKSDPELPDSPAKTLLGHRQRRWLLRTLSASDARFKIVCSPCTVFMPANARDGNWAAGFNTERDKVLKHIRRRVAGTTIFLTGDTHLTGVYDGDDGYEARAAPIDIPKPNDITLVSPTAAEDLRGQANVTYASDDCHFTLLEVSAKAVGLSLVRDDGTVPYTRKFA